MIEIGIWTNKIFMGIFKKFELRFMAVYDRFGENLYEKRTVESLKDRYYFVSKIF